ncbi:hypothetical protein E2C01_000553 [Portunus trituberculatus]|uniref:Uncharacterized protein n=1 Tax=Portunus trituberculatus TaxID=210409 RepID=A0A5B7CGV8_PORTR|nr:hypothetical protein [Portunus trituberculatus]
MNSSFPSNIPPVITTAIIVIDGLVTASPPSPPPSSLLLTLSITPASPSSLQNYNREYFISSCVSSPHSQHRLDVFSNTTTTITTTSLSWEHSSGRRCEALIVSTTSGVLVPSSPLSVVPLAPQHPHHLHYHLRLH